MQVCEEQQTDWLHYFIVSIVHGCTVGHFTTSHICNIYVTNKEPWTLQYRGDTTRTSSKTGMLFLVACRIFPLWLLNLQQLWKTKEEERIILDIESACQASDLSGAEYVKRETNQWGSRFIPPIQLTSLISSPAELWDYCQCSGAGCLVPRWVMERAVKASATVDDADSELANAATDVFIF